jgi:hypothetical protein
MPPISSTMMPDKRPVCTSAAAASLLPAEAPTTATQRTTIVGGTSSTANSLANVIISAACRSAISGAFNS